jgi:hypothetical protein
MAIELIHNNNKILYFPSLCDKRYHGDLLKQILSVETNTNINISDILINHDYVKCTRLIYQFVDHINHYQDNDLKKIFFGLTGWDKNLYIYVISQNILLSQILSFRDIIRDNINTNRIDSNNKIVFGHREETNLHIVTIYSKFIPNIKYTEENFIDIKKTYKALLTNDYSDIANKKIEELELKKSSIEESIIKNKEMQMRLQSNLQKSPYYHFESNKLDFSFYEICTKRNVFDKKINKIQENIERLQPEKDILEKRIEYLRKMEFRI